MGITMGQQKAPDSVEISPDVPDWSRETSAGMAASSKALLASIRSYQYYARNPGWTSAIMRRLAVIRHVFWSIVTGADIPLNCKIGGGLLMPHPNGVVIHPDAVIGPNCLIFQQVTIGASRNGVPRIGGHVDIGAGAKIIGPVTVGDHAVIGANALVVFDVPARATVRATPGTIIAPG